MSVDFRPVLEALSALEFAPRGSFAREARRAWSAIRNAGLRRGQGPRMQMACVELLLARAAADDEIKLLESPTAVHRAAFRAVYLEFGRNWQLDTCASILGKRWILRGFCRRFLGWMTTAEFWEFVDAVLAGFRTADWSMVPPWMSSATHRARHSPVLWYAETPAERMSVLNAAHLDRIFEPLWTAHTGPLNHREPQVRWDTLAEYLYSWIEACGFVHNEALFPNMQAAVRRCEARRAAQVHHLAALHLALPYAKDELTNLIGEYM